LQGLSWEPKPQAWPDGEGTHVLILGSGPADEYETASLFFTNALNLASKRIWIATPYFIPDEATMVALRLALLKGIDVRILTPALNDNWFVRHASNVYLSDLSQMGARIYFYQNGFMHQKVMLVDDEYSLVGTVNFDNRSFRLNFEVTATVADHEFATEIESMLQDDFSASSELMEYRLDDQSLWERLKARGSALLAPVL
jgi:cardiolipin synthase